MCKFILSEGENKMKSNLYNEYINPYLEVNNSEIKNLYHYTSAEGLMGILREGSIKKR